MVKAFKVFGVKISYFGEMTHSHDTDEYDSDSSDVSVQNREDENEKCNNHFFVLFNCN